MSVYVTKAEVDRMIMSRTKVWAGPIDKRYMVVIQWFEGHRFKIARITAKQLRRFADAQLIQN